MGWWGGWGFNSPVITFGDHGAAGGPPAPPKGGLIVGNYQLVAGNYGVQTSDGVIDVNAAGGPVTVTLYSVSSVSAPTTLVIKKVDATFNQVIVAVTGVNTIDGQASIALGVPNAVVGLYTDGTTDWRVMFSYLGL